MEVVCLKCVSCICVCRGVVTLCNACVTNIIKQWKQNRVPDNSADSHYISAVQKDRRTEGEMPELLHTMMSDRSLSGDHKSNERTDG